MNKTKVFLIALTTLLFSSANASALVTMDFEDFPLQYIYDGIPPEPIDIGNYYSGVNFVGRAAIMDTESVLAGRWPWGFPPHSGTGALHSFPVGPVDIVFDAPVNYVEGWFAFNSYDGYLGAYDAFDNLVDSDAMAPNPPYSPYGRLSVSGAGITRVRITNAANNFYWLGDDIAYGTEGGSVIPEPASLLLFGLGGLGLGVVNRRRRQCRSI